MQLRQDFHLFQKLDATILVLGPDDKAAFQQFWRLKDLPFIGIPDPELKVLSLYGQQVKVLKLGRMPAMVVIDKTGLIRYIHYGSSMRDIPANTVILELLKKLS